MTSNQSPHTPTEDEVLEAIKTVFGRNTGAFSNMGNAKLHQCIKRDNPTWALSQARLKGIKERGLASRRLQEPSWYAGRDYRPSKDMVKEMSSKYVSAKRWRDWLPAEFGELRGTFEITSGALIWGQLRALAEGLKTTKNDLPGAERNEQVPGTVVQSYGMQYRAPAKNGTWKVAVIEGKGNRNSKSGWLVYHSSCSPLPLLRAARLVHFGTRTSNPRVTYVNRYDWTWHGPDPGQFERTLADLEPEIWRLPFDRKHGLWIEGKDVNNYHQDFELWERLDIFRGGQCFLLDADKSAHVLKLMARPTAFDNRVKEKKPSSFFPPSSLDPADGERYPFGCNLPLHPYGEYDVARLMFSPDEDEIVAFWYDTFHYEYEPDEMKLDPYFEDV